METWSRWLQYAHICCPQRKWETSTRNPSLVLTTINQTRSPPMVNWKRFPNLNSLLRVCSLFYKFSAINCDFTSTILPGEDAIRIFSERAGLFEKGRENPLLTDPLLDLGNHLNLFQDDKLIRRKGRLLVPIINFQVLNPTLLGEKHYFTTLDIHHECKHLGSQATLTNIRLKGFWITSPKATTKRVLAECILYKKS